MYVEESRKVFEKNWGDIQREDTNTKSGITIMNSRGVRSGAIQYNAENKQPIFILEIKQPSKQRWASINLHTHSVEYAGERSLIVLTLFYSRGFEPPSRSPFLPSPLFKDARLEGEKKKKKELVVFEEWLRTDVKLKLGHKFKQKTMKKTRISKYKSALNVFKSL